MSERTEHVDVGSGDAYTYDEAVELTGHGRYNYLLLAACCIITNAFSLDMFGYATVVAASSCDLQLGLLEIGILASAPFAGVLFAFPWGYYADTGGRRRALVLSTAVGFLFATTSSLAPSWQFMLVVKLIGCTFSSASFTLSMTILGECTGIQHRSQFLHIMNSFNLASEMVSFGLAYFILPLNFNVPLPWLGISYRPWRLFAFIMSLPLGIGALFMFFLYESPKYLASRGDHVNALKVLKRIYDMNGGKKDEYPVKHLLTTDSETDKSSSFWKSIPEHTVPIFKPPLLWRTLQLFFLLALCCGTNNVFVMWFPTMVNFFFNSFDGEQMTGQSFCDRIYNQTNVPFDAQTYECNDTISPNTIYIGMLLGLFFFVVNLAVSKVASRPRLLLITILIVSGVSSTLVNLKEPVANLVFFTLVQATGLGIGCVAAYFVDLYPTCHRGLVTSLGMMVARLVSFTGVNLISIVITSHCELTFYFMSCLAFNDLRISQEGEKLNATLWSPPSVFRNNVFVMWFPTMVNFFFNSFDGEQMTGQSFCDRIYNQTNVPFDAQTYECNDTISPNTIYIGMLLGLFFFVVNLAVSKVASRPRLLLITILIVSGVSSTLVNLKEPVANLVFFTLVQATGLGIGCVAAYFVDLYPTCHRGLVTSLGMMVARLVSFTGVNLISIVITSHCELTFYFMSCLAFSGVVVSLFLPPDRKKD